MNLAVGTLSPASGQAAPPQGRHAIPIRVLIVDDSLVARTVLRRMLEQAGGFQVVGEAAGTDEAFRILRTLSCDIVLLDVVMPGTDGLTALPDLLAAGNGARFVMVSGACAEGAAATINALALGAADTLLKPDTGRMGAPFATILGTRLRRLGHAAPAAAGHARRPGANDPPSTRPPARRGPVDCIAIGSSTGGIHALASFFATFPRDAVAPILVTQHLPPPFMAFFAAQLGEMIGRHACVAEDGMALRPRTVLVAPGDGHLSLARHGRDVRVRIDRAPAASGCLPSVDPMFRAVADIYGERGVGIVLSGMGRDGSIGAQQVVGAGGEVIAQDQASSVVWGMPGTVATAGLASEVAPPPMLARHVARRMGLGAAAVAGAAIWN